MNKSRILCVKTWEGEDRRNHDYTIIYIILRFNWRRRWIEMLENIHTYILITTTSAWVFLTIFPTQFYQFWVYPTIFPTQFYQFESILSSFLLNSTSFESILPTFLLNSTSLSPSYHLSSILPVLSLSYQLSYSILPVSVSYTIFFYCHCTWACCVVV